MRNPSPTLKDLARHLGLSVSTVSRALRRQAGVHPQTAEAVQRLARELGYQPNSVALSLVQQRTHTLGVLIPQFEIPFYASAISGMQDEAARLGYQLLVCQSNESFALEQQSLGTLMRSQVEGVIISLSRESVGTDHLRCLRQRGVPYVLFNRIFADQAASKVYVDDRHGARLATAHLSAQGCRRLAHIAGPSNLPMCHARRLGFTDGLESSPSEGVGIEACDFTYEGGYQAALRLLPRQPDGLFVVCDTAAFGAMQALKEAGLRIPQDVAVVGFTDERAAAMISPSLSTIAQPSYEIGQLAAKVMIEHVEDGSIPLRNEQFRTELIVRESSRRRV